MVAVTVARETSWKRTSGWLGGLRRKLLDGAAVIGAAIRVSRAVESRQDAHPEDLAMLGVKGPLPKAW